MEKLKALGSDAARALTTLEEIQHEPYSVIVRDAAIQRFEYTFEVVWKLTREHLKVHEGVIANSPKSLFREAFKAGFLDEAQTVMAIEMTDDRNRTVHTYHQEVADAIFSRIPAYWRLMRDLAEALT